MVQMSGSSHSNAHGATGGSNDKQSKQGSNPDLQEKLRKRFQRRALSRASNSSGSQNTSPAPRLEDSNGSHGAARVHESELSRRRRFDRNNTPDLHLNDPDGNGNFMFSEGEQNSPKPSRSFKGLGKGQGQNAPQNVLKSDPIDSALNTVLGEMQNDKSKKKKTKLVESGPVFQNNFDDEELSPSDSLQAQARPPAKLQRVQHGHHKPPSRVPFRMEDDCDGDDEDTETDDPSIRRGQGYVQGQAQNVDPIKQMMDSLMGFGPNDQFGNNREQGGINANDDPIAALMDTPRQGVNGGDNMNPFADMFGNNVDNSFDTFFQNMRNDGHNAQMNAQQSQNQILGQQIGQENDPLPALRGQRNHSADDRLWADPLPGAENGYENVGQHRNAPIEVDEGIRKLLLGGGEKRVRRRHRGWESLWDPEDNPVISDGEDENPSDNPLASLLLPFGRNNDNGRDQNPFAAEGNGGGEGGYKPVPRNSGGPIGNTNHVGEHGRNPLHALFGGSSGNSNDSNDLVQQTLQTMLGGLDGNEQNNPSQFGPSELLSLMGPGIGGNGQGADMMSGNPMIGSNNGQMGGPGLSRPGFMGAGQMGPSMTGANAMVPAQMGANQMALSDNIDPENHTDSDVLAQLSVLEGMGAEQNKAPRADQGLHTIIVVDISGSMEGEPFLGAGTFITEFINGLAEIQFEYNQQENVALVCVGESVQVVQHFTNDYSLIERAADTLLTGGPSNLLTGLVLSGILLNQGSYDNRQGMGGVYQIGSHTAQPRIILISDGYPTQNLDIPGCIPEERETLAMQSSCISNIAGLANTTLMKVYCVPVGTNVHLNFLEMLSQSTGGRVVNPSEARYLSRSVLHHVLFAKLKETSIGEPDRSTVVRVLQQVTAAADDVDVDGVFEVYHAGEPDLESRDQRFIAEAREKGLALPDGENSAMMMGKMMGSMPSRGQQMSAPSGFDLSDMSSRGQGMPASSGVDFANMSSRDQGMSAPTGMNFAGISSRGQEMSAPAGIDFANMSSRGQAPTGVEHVNISDKGNYDGFERMAPGIGSSMLGDQGGQDGQKVPLDGMPPTLAKLMGLSGEQNLDGLKQLSSLKGDNHNQEDGVDALFGNIKRNEDRQRRELDFDVMFSGFDRDRAMHERLNAENPISQPDLKGAMQGGVGNAGQDSGNNQFGLNESMFQPSGASSGRPNFSESTLRRQLVDRDQSQRQAQNNVNGINQQEVNDDPIKQMSAMLTNQNKRERNSMVDSTHGMGGSSSLRPVIPHHQQPRLLSMQQVRMLQSRQNEINEPSQVGQGSVFRRINPNLQNVRGGDDMAGLRMQGAYQRQQPGNGGNQRIQDGLPQQNRQHGQYNGSGRNSRQSRGQYFNGMPQRKEDSHNPKGFD